MEAADAATAVDLDHARAVLREGARAVREALATVDDLRRPGRRRGQYHLDLVADDAVRSVLHRGGFEVFSEESGRTGAPADGHPDVLVVVDPVDGSTNASIGLPWFSTSLCVLDSDGPVLSLVVNQATGTRYEAVRGGGAWRDGTRIASSGVTDLAHAVVGISGLPAGHPGWAQFRALGSASLDLCAVAEGVLDGYRVAGRTTLAAWDYLGALLVCTEAGAVVGDCDGRELVVRDASPRRPCAAASRALFDQLVVARV